jgi:hypothetical protein
MPGARLLRTFLNFFAGFFYVLAEAMGRFTTNTDDSQERGDEQQNNDVFG